jgi:hypothetical protein
MKLPFIANPALMFLVFFSEVAILHVLLIASPPLRLEKRGWAVVQYLVIALAVVGLSSAIAGARKCSRRICLNLAARTWHLRLTIYAG